jgi:replicative DNA helicase
MADIARALICKIIDDNDLTTAMRSGIRVDWFEDKDHRAVYKWMLDYYQRYSEVPTEVALKNEFPNFKMVYADEPYDYYTDQFREIRKRAILIDSIIDANEEIEKHGDTKAAQGKLSEVLLALGRETGILSDVNVVHHEHIKSRYSRYEDRRKSSGELIGVPTGFTTFDEITGGYTAQQFILFGGAQKQGKSFMLMKSAIAAQSYGHKVLFLSFEMSEEEQTSRYDAMTTGINASHLLRGRLEDKSMLRLKKGMAARKNMEDFIISSDISAMTTISALSAKIEEHRPDVVYVDGVYLMDNEVGADPFSTQAFTSISRGLKRLTQRVEIPLVGTTQALSSKMGKGGEVNMHSFGWTSAWAQDADLLYGVEKTPGANLLTVRIAGGRNVPIAEVSVSCNWEESCFEEVEIGEEDD